MKKKGSLQKKIEEKISHLKKIADDSPSVIIVHSLKDQSVQYMSPRGLKTLRVTMEELKKMGADYHPRFFNMVFAEIYTPKILGLMERNNNDEIVSFVQQVRASEKEEWTWYLSCTKIFMRDDEGRPISVITHAIPLDPKLYIDSAKAERMLEENNFLRKNHTLFNSLTNREKEILRLMALGNSSARIAKQMHISEKTANTHRRNVKKKLNAKTNYDLVRFAQAFDLI